MKQFVLIFFALLPASVTVLEAQNLRAELALARFYSPADGPYLETYLKLKGNSLKMTKADNGYLSQVILNYKVLQNGKSVFEDAFMLNGPIVKDSVSQDFIDIQRIPLDKGDYELMVTMRDKQDSEIQTVEVKQSFKIEKPIDAFAALNQQTSGGITSTINYYISDIQLIDSYSKTVDRNMLSKNGFDLVPYTSNFYPETKESLTFYTEIYNTDKRALQTRGAGDLFADKSLRHKYLINTFIESADDGKLFENLGSFFKHDSAAVIPILHSFPLEKVPSGNYNFVVELRDSENNLLERKLMFFQRSNSVELEYVMPSELTDMQEIALTFVGKYNRPEELKEYLRCLHPISSQQEIQTVNRKMNFNDVDMMKKFMYNFWKQRNPENPEAAWLKYWKEVEKVNANYSNNLRSGYDTDRGRVYLQYGPPNTISPNYFEPNTYPYEIWHYYVLRDHLNADQSNRKFVFANTEQGTKEFLLIHSDAKNEITNVRWNYDLHKRSNATIDLDQENSGDHYGGRSRDFFENPY